jgi:AcrR family transcriptional regulator
VSSPKLPPALELLWGRRAAGRRGPKAELSVDRIVEAAVAIADADGLEAVSMARVAKELGFTPMSLYRHVSSKDDLLQLMWNASAQGAEALVLEGEGWRERLRHWALVQREAIDAHPWITQMPLAQPPMAPNSLTFVERGLEALDGTGLTGADKVRIIGLISSYTLSEARMAHDAARAAESPWSFEALLRELVDERAYPRLHRLAWAAEPPEPDERAEFLFGLERILDGVEALISRGPGRASADRGSPAR